MNFFYIRIVIGCFLSFCLTLYLVPLFSSIAVRLKFVDTPDGNIKKHERPIPYLGGIAVFIGHIASFIFVAPVMNEFLLLIPCISLLLCLGLIDDFVRLKAGQKFMGQCIATLCFLKSGFYLKSNFFLSSWHLLFISLWILLVINAFNLIDVMDGLASLVALISGLFFLFIAIMLNLPSLTIFLACFIGALGAFFMYNKPPASIYLGDAGSLCIGGIFATLPFLFPWGTYNSLGFFTPVIILAIPLFEISSLFILRTWHGIPFYKASSHHFSLILLARGHSKKEILLITLILAILAGCTSLLFFLNYVDLIVIMPLGVLFLILWTVVIAIR